MHYNRPRNIKKTLVLSYAESPVSHFAFESCIHQMSTLLACFHCCLSRYVSRVVEYQKKIFSTFDYVFHLYLMRRLQKYARNFIPTMVSEGIGRQNQILLANGLDWLSYLSGR